MRIRTKFLIILLLMAVVPLLATFAIGQLSTRRLGDRLTQETSAELINLAEDRLRQKIRSDAKIISTQAALTSTSVQLQRLYALQALSGPVPQYAEIYRAELDFDQRRRTPPGLIEMPIFHSGQTQEFIAVSPDVMAFLPAPDVGFDLLRDDAARLTTITNLIAALYDPESDVALNHYIATETGLHATYPGHGGFPPDYDPRNRTWYQSAKAERSIIWTPPITDAATGRLIITVATPIIKENGEFLGVTAIDVVVTDLLGSRNLDVAFTPSERQLIVIPDDVFPELRNRASVSAPPGESLIIYAQQSYQDETRNWRRDPALDVFQVDDPDANRRINQAVRRSESGLIRTTMNLVDVFIAIAPLGTNSRRTSSSIITVVPVDDLLSLTDTVETTFLDQTLAQLAANGTIVLIVLIGVVVIAFRGSRHITRPILELSDAATRVANGELDVQLNTEHRHQYDEIGETTRAFDAMVPKLRDQLRLRSSLDLAMEVQQALLPAEPPDFPGLDIHGLSVYCDETGGDYYDFLTIKPIGPERLGVVIGDVTGHGIAAALLMTTARALLRAHSTHPGSLAHIIEEVNRALAQDVVDGSFMTLAFILFDRPDNTIRSVNAGHDPAFLYDPRSDTFEEIASDGIPLGIDANWRYHESTHPALKIGQIVVIGTDGIWEQRDSRGKMFGKDRLREIIKANATKSSDLIAHAIVDAVHIHRGEVPQSDDITLVVIRAVEK